jgi:hypothetical protein
MSEEELVTPELSRSLRTISNMNTGRWLAFELPPAALGHSVAVRLGDFEGRWASIVRCGATTTRGLGVTAREALLAALTPFGARATAVLMAEPAMFGASADLFARIAI